MLKRLTVVLILVVCCILSPYSLLAEDNADGKATQQAIKSLRRVISVDMTNVTLDEALLIIARKGNIKLNYNQSRIPVQKKVTLYAESITAGEALHMVLQGTGVEVVLTAGRQIALIPSNAQEKAPLRPQKGNIQGMVQDYLSGISLPGVKIELLDSNEKGITDLTGRFVINAIPVGTYSVVFSCPGYEDLLLENVLIQNKQTTAVEPKMTLIPFEAESEIVDVVASYRSDKNPLSAYSLSADEIQGDPEGAGAVARLSNVVPGISFITDENLDYVVRGGCPLENGFYVDNIEVPGIGHIPAAGSNGGFYSLLNPQIIRNVDLFAGCFSSDYGDRLSSITQITLREGNRQKTVGKIDASMAGFGTMVEGPLIGSLGSWLFSVRKSNLKFLQDLGVNLETVPNTFDSQVKFTLDISPKHKINILNFYGTGTFREFAVDHQYRVDMGHLQNTLGINWSSFWHKNLFSTTSLSYTHLKRTDAEYVDPVPIPRDVWRLDEASNSFSFKNSNFLVLSESHKLDFGFQVKHESVSLNHLVHQPLQDISGDTLQDSRLNLFFRDTKYGLFSSYMVSPVKSLAITVGLRSDYSSVQKTFTFSPRFSLACRLSDTLAVKGGVGVFHQTLPAKFLAYIPNTSGLKDMKATHYILGLEHISADGTRVSLEGYIKDYENLPISPDAPFTLLTDLFLDPCIDGDYGLIGYRIPAFIENSGTAISRGIDFFLHKKWTQKFSSSMSLSYFRSQYTDFFGFTRDRIFDARYIINFIGRYNPTPRWDLRLGWIIMGGAPFTPVNPFRAIEVKDQILNESLLFTHRYPEYSRINFRISRAFHFSDRNLFLYLDVMNVLNQKNVSSYHWDDWGNFVGTGYQLGIIPVFGLQIDF